MTQNSSTGVKIGRLAAETGVHLETIRYYQRLGLMRTPQRPHGAVRRYGEDAASRLRFIKRAQALGFSLDEVKRLLDLASGMHCAQTRTLAERKLRLVQSKISDLLGIEQALNKLIRACNAGTRGRGCPIIENLSGTRRKQHQQFGL
ncbi:MAG TPA: MerR family DNA-binding protein [Burkholderiales bacterium]|jgi:MerR family mercuric resistance operon transcriptional regulator|nr:MerR family DNA-binding protein [Burkholderiales bacterium]